ncbi:MAG: acyl-CoA dehydrogenase C-terminal domain-containing protein, partial [Desulfamplus sp.]|nr:acyl-CoA dehydrogenase C-terminal domain-containing protein [Desulfamplus sp.]
LGMKKGKSFGYFIELIQKTIKDAKDSQGLENITKKLQIALDKFISTAKVIGDRSRSSDMVNAYSFAHPFLEVTGDITMAWMLLWRASVAAPKLLQKAGSLDRAVVKEKSEKNKDVAYYAGQIMTAEFFINTILPSTLGKMDAIVDGDKSVEEMPEASFGSR